METYLNWILIGTFILGAVITKIGETYRTEEGKQFSYWSPKYLFLKNEERRKYFTPEGNKLLNIGAVLAIGSWLIIIVRLISNY